MASGDDEVYTRRIVGFKLKRKPIRILSADEEYCADSVENCCVESGSGGSGDSGGSSGSGIETPVYDRTCGTTPPCYLPDRVRVTITGTPPELPPGGVVVYTEPFPPGGIEIWSLVAGDAVELGWHIGGTIDCADGIENGTCGGPLRYSGGASGNGVGAGYGCDLFFNQSTTGTLIPLDVTITLIMGSDSYVLHIEDYGPGDPDCEEV